MEKCHTKNTTSIFCLELHELFQEFYEKKMLIRKNNSLFREIYKFINIKAYRFELFQNFENFFCVKMSLKVKENQFVT